MSNTPETRPVMEVPRRRDVDGGRHDPSAQLRSIDDHLTSATRLSRAMYLALDGKHNFEFDQRDILALYELASVVAHHSSSALHLYENNDQ